MDDLDVLSRYPVSRWRLSVADYYRLAEIGILHEDDRVELIEGQIVKMAAIGPRHCLAVDALNELLTDARSSATRVRVQSPVLLDDSTEPQPDIAVVRRPWSGYPTQHPGPGDVFLLVEVADSSLDYDQGAKRILYARSGIQEFWIVDLTADVVRIHRKPVGDTYTETATKRPDDILSIEALPGIAIPAGPIFSLNGRWRDWAVARLSAAN